MKKRIVSNDAYHSYYVSKAVNTIQENDCEVIKIKKINKMKFLIFGEDITEITYNQL